MRVYELANELGIHYKEVVKLARTTGVKVASHFNKLSAQEAALLRAAYQRLRSRDDGPKPPSEAVVLLPPGKIVIVPPEVAPAARPVPSVSATAPSAAPRAKGPLIAFASLKGGVGKTTMSLCAAELLRSWQPRTVKRAGLATPPPTKWPVVLIDADVAGTELHWVWNQHCGSQDGRPLYEISASLIDLLEERADRTEVFSRLMKDAEALARDPVPRGLIVPTFTPGTEMRLPSLEWKQILELTGTFVRQVMIRVIEALRDTGCAVVVDLPAFDVGFAHHAAEAVRKIKGQVFLVTDCDMRSLRSTEQWLGAYLQPSEEKDTIWRDVVVNRAPDRSWRDQFPDRLAEVAHWGDQRSDDAAASRFTADFIRPVVALGAPHITKSTTLRGSSRELFEAISSYIVSRDELYLDDRGRRRLRGDAEPPR